MAMEWKTGSSTAPPSTTTLRPPSPVRTKAVSRVVRR
ncbi:hypothetical protein CHKEEEPN_2675 [Methylorubrum podarium]|nr:hypothetical protein CHKEEEPN_2675 [Methylorubrum podarium]